MRNATSITPAPGLPLARTLSATGRFRVAAKNRWAALPYGDDQRENAFAPYRRRILYPIAIVGALVFLPLAINNYVEGRTLLGGLLLLAVVMLAADALALHHRKTPPIPFAMLLLPGAACMALSLTTQGIYGALWAYPMVMFAYFVLPRRLANATSIGLLAMTGAFVYVQIDHGTALRVVLSMGLCLVTVNIIFNVLESMHHRLLAQSLTDALTGAFNRRHMETCLRDVIERFRRTRSPAVALILDIDHFKKINDELGHEAGDRVLQAIVSLVDERARKLDLLFRMGGEEFLLLLPDTRLPEAMVVAEHLRAAIERLPIVPKRPVTVSVGAAELEDGEDSAKWLKRADDALYRAKGAGRNRVMR